MLGGRRTMDGRANTVGQEAGCGHKPLLLSGQATSHEPTPQHGAIARGLSAPYQFADSHSHPEMPFGTLKPIGAVENTPGLTTDPQGTLYPIYMRIFLVFALAVSSSFAEGDVLLRIAKHAEKIGGVSRQIWENPELGYQETQSSHLLQQELREDVAWPHAGLHGSNRRDR
jgi:hypothetical protein